MIFECALLNDQRLEAEATGTRKRQRKSMTALAS